MDEAQAVEYEKAIDTFKLAARDSNRATAYQLTVLIFAVALSFVAWASLAADDSQTRKIFTLMCLVAFVVGIVQMIRIPVQYP